MKLQPKESEEKKVQGLGKRKTKDNEAAPASRKRAKTQIPKASSRAKGGSFGIYGNGLDESGSLNDRKLMLSLICLPADFLLVTVPFMRQLYALQSILPKNPARVSIVLAAVDLCKAAEDALRAVNCEGKVPTGRTKTSFQAHSSQPDANSILHGVQYAYEILCQALDKLSGSHEETRETGQLIYHMVSLFETAMELLQRNSKAKAENMLVDIGSSKKQKKNTKIKASKDMSEHQGLLKTVDDKLATHISSLLYNMMLHLNPSKREHRNLLEGFLFMLLNRVGKVLCVFVFRDLRLKPDLRGDTTKLPLPEGLIGINPDNDSLKAMKIEARSLIWLMERTMPLVGVLYGPHSETEDIGKATTSHDKPRDVPLPLRVKKKLQNTLLSAVFGDDLMFKDSLKGPELSSDTELEKLRTQEAIPEKTIPDWFVQEVWALLGWDILMEKGKN